MLREVRLNNFKAFETFTLTSSGDTYLVGPNNAGKSTLVVAMRSCARMLRLAMAREPGRAYRDGGVHFRAFPLDGSRIGLVEENLRHEFRPSETRLHVRFDHGASITAVWPSTTAEATDFGDGASDNQDSEEDGESGGFFYLDVEGKRQPLRPAEVRRAFPALAVVPVLTPVEHRETLLKDDYVRQQAEGRLVSRHFRNHLHLLQCLPSDTHPSLWEEFLEFASPWIPELRIAHLRRQNVPGSGVELDLFYTEIGRRALKEIFWAGDGMQVWLQLLLHVFRNRNVDTLILDEPDLYLHADLQRRLVRLLESVEVQTITATHSPEMLAEAKPEAISWVDKSRRRAVRNPKADLLAVISDTMGTQFNLRLAKALRSRVVLFVEGKDMRLLSLLAKSIGATNVAGEAGIAVVPLGGFSNWEHVEPFAWLVNNFLDKSVTTFVILDRDYRSEVEVQALIDRLEPLGISAHVWQRKEIESYLLDRRVLCRVSGASPGQMDDLLNQAAEAVRAETFSRGLAAAQRRSDRRLSLETMIEQFQEEFESLWGNVDHRMAMLPPKELITELNRRLSAAGLNPVSPRRLAQRVRSSEIDSEVRDVLLSVERATERPSGD